MGQARLSPSARWLRWAAFLLVALLGLAIRLPQLDARPMHTDEAVNAFITGQLLSGKSFAYDARDRHGPALAAFALPIARLQGAKSFSDLTENQLRLTPGLAGSGTILLCGAAVDLFGFIPCLVAALFLATASLPVYYDRYFIHESLFVAATFGLILSAARARRSALFAALAGACAALMLASKETAVLHFVALGVSAVIVWFIYRHDRPSPRILRVRHLLIAAGVFLLVSVALFTWFGANWGAVPALFHAGPHLTARAAGQGHQKPILYFARLLISTPSGAVIGVLACIGLVRTFARSASHAFRFLACYLAVILAIYSLIPYKTPWLALNFFLPLALLAGLAFETFWHGSSTFSLPRNVGPGLCILIAVPAIFFIARDTRRLVFQQPAAEDNPYAYAHTVDDVAGVPALIALVSQQNHIASPRIAVVAADPWPLPWYLRHYAQTGFWQPGQQPGPADFYVTTPDLAGEYQGTLRDLHPDYFGVRPNTLLILWSPAPK